MHEKSRGVPGRSNADDDSITDAVNVRLISALIPGDEVVAIVVVMQELAPVLPPVQFLLLIHDAAFLLAHVCAYLEEDADDIVDIYMRMPCLYGEASQRYVLEPALSDVVDLRYCGYRKI